MKFAIYQFNPTVGALESNATKLIAAINEAVKHKCDVFITSELALCGYIPKDVLFRPEFHQQTIAQLNRFLHIKRGITILLPATYVEGGNCYNSVFIIRDGQIIDRADKQELPNYEVFDECRYFTPGKTTTVFEHQGVKLGVIICRDMWFANPSALAKQNGAEILISINASPFNAGKCEKRLAAARERVHETSLPLIYVNQVGGQDNIVFDGASFILDAAGQLITCLPAFTEDLSYYDINLDKSSIHANTSAPTTHTPPFIKNASSSKFSYPGEVAATYHALVLATKDYVIKNGFKGVLLGLSGGIDSALTLVIACAALGADKVMAVMMPSIYTADISIDDSRATARRLNVQYEEIEIDSIFNQFKEQLSPVFVRLTPHTSDTKDVTEENLQARTRGILLMALSNKLGYLVLTTGNKSEMAVGYTTLYGDMAGGFAVLGDVPKTLVYRLCTWINDKYNIIPERIITRAPSAELRAGQTDQDSLPDYNTLDAIIDLLVGQKLSSAEIIASKSFAADTVIKIAGLIKRNEYKRHQAAVSPKVTACAFNSDWRYPITNHFQF